MPERLVVDISNRYMRVFEKITGEKFKEYNYPIEDRIMNNLKKIYPKLIKE